MVDADLMKKFFGPRSIGRRAVDLKRVLSARFADRRHPMFVQFLVTSRCNLDCTYCELPPSDIEEMEDGEIKGLLEDLCRLGMRKITFTGGEPLVRHELADWMKLVKDRGVFASVTTNGAYVPDRIDVIRMADLVMVSLDGPRVMHDKHRGAGSHDAAIRAIETCRYEGVRVMTSTVFHPENLDGLDHVLDLTREMGITAVLQPVEIEHPATRARAGHLEMEGPAVREAFRYLLSRKREGYAIAYPRALLKRFAAGHRAGQCRWAGRLFCSILPDGRVVPCNLMMSRDLDWVDWRRGGVIHAMRAMPDFECNGCHAGFVELDGMLSFRLLDML